MSQLKAEDIIPLETGIKKEELFSLRTIHFDLSNRYAPELWVKHSGKKVKKDRKLKLPPEVVPVFEDYVKQFDISDILGRCGITYQPGGRVARRTPLDGRRL